MIQPPILRGIDLAGRTDIGVNPPPNGRVYHIRNHRGWAQCQPKSTTGYVSSGWAKPNRRYTPCLRCYFRS